MSTEHQPGPNPGDQHAASAQLVDISGNPRIPVLLEMVDHMTQANDPRGVVEAFIEAMRKAYGPRGYVALSTAGLKPWQYRIARWHALDGREQILPADLQAVRSNLPVHSGGFFGRMIQSAAPKIFHHMRIRNDPVVGDSLADFGSAIAVPLVDRDAPVNWVVLLERDPTGCTIEELEQTLVRANLVSATVRNIMINEQLREASRFVNREIEQIAALQRAMLPQKMPDITGLRIAASYATFGPAGGDYYDVFPLSRATNGGRPDPNGRWGLLIADASGHGPSAAVVAAMLHATLHTFPREPDGPSEVLEYLNRHLYARTVAGSFVTAFLGIYDPATRGLTYARAGHNPPLIKDPGLASRMLCLDDIGGFPLGVADEVASGEGSVRLEPGQTLVLYTDGVTEEICPNGTLFGMSGLQRALQRSSGAPEHVVQVVNEDLRAHQSWTQPDDDQTLMAAQVLPPGDGPVSG